MDQLDDTAPGHEVQRAFFAHSGRRKRPRQAEVLAAQRRCCSYCRLPFGTAVQRTRGHVQFLRPCWDHVIPFSYLQDNPEGNWRLICHVCNQLKGSWMSESVEDLLAYVLGQRDRRGWRRVFGREDFRPDAIVNGLPDPTESE